MVQSTYSLDFSGTPANADSRLDCAAAGVPGTTSACTLSVWAYLRTITNGSNSALLDLAASSGRNLTFQIAQISGTYYVATDGVAWNQALTAGQVPSLNTWHHLCLTHNGAGSFNFYTDGSLTLAFSQTVAAGTIGNVYIGHRVSGASGYMDGILDDAAIFPAELNSTQVAGLAAGTLNPATLTTALLLRMEEGSGTTTADASGNGNNGTLLNASANTPPADGVTYGPIWSTNVPSQLAGGTGSWWAWERAYDLAGGF